MVTLRAITMSQVIEIPILSAASRVTADVLLGQRVAEQRG